MYTLTRYNEIDLEYVYRSTLSRVIFLKSKRANIKRPKLRLIVLFRNVMEPDFTKIYLHVLMLWIMTGKLPKVKKIGHSLRRGNRYYRYILQLNLFDSFRFYRFVEFMLYCLFDYVTIRNFYSVTERPSDSYFVVKNINGFTNVRFSDSFYLSGMPNDLIINFFKQTIKTNYFDSSAFFMSILKLI
jgi:hypothetical protein